MEIKESRKSVGDAEITQSKPFPIEIPKYNLTTGEQGDNPRKDKILYNLWLTEEEERMIKECIEILPSLGATILNNAIKRGDFKKR